MPTWGADLSALDFEDIYYYLRASDKSAKSWEDVPAYVKRTFDQLGIPQAEQKYLAGVGAQYDCLHEDSLVQTSNGPVPIKSIEPGDIVFSFSEVWNEIRPARVKARVAKGPKPVFEVKVGTRTIRVTENHPFLALTDERRPGRIRNRFHRRWRYLSELKVGDLVAFARKTPDVGLNQVLASPELNAKRAHTPVSFPKESDVDLMWWAGVYAGDGYLHNVGPEKKNVEFAIPETQPDLRSEVAAVTKKLFGLDAVAVDEWRLRIYSEPLAAFVKLNGLGGKALEKRVPEWVFATGESERLAFLGGYVDADGHVRTGRSKDMSLTSGNSLLLADARRLASTCGVGTSTIHTFKSRHPHERTRFITGYRMQFSGDFDRISCRSIRRTERMHARRFFHKGTNPAGTTVRAHTNEFMGFARIESISQVGVAETYDIAVDGPHNFVAEGLIVHNSESVYHNIRKDLEKLGVIFMDTDTALKEHEDIVKQYFGTVIPANDNKLAALNTAVWSGGSFVWVPPGVKVEIPLQAYFRINSENAGQFERTLIIAEEGSSVHYVEGCTAPVFSSNTLHSAVVEIIVKKNADVRYTTIQNWSHNVYNLVTKRAVVQEAGRMTWIDANLGSKVTMKYPSVYLVGERAHGEVLSVAFAASEQHQDAGAKMIHAAKNTTSLISSKSISKGTGRTSYRGLVKIYPGAEDSKSTVRCDALILDDTARSDTYPYMEVDEEKVTIGHEASVSKVGEEQLFYLMSRGLSEAEATAMVVNGFIEPIVKTLPMDYAIEMNRLITLSMQGAIG
ncbi:MAG: Fe-S cluster assembly protein SufB [Chloroflexi bacterium]|nr:MAG: Fe-S cluster assembly protein SufB [Chloroflexota bacterium]